MKSQQRTILLVDDHLLYREGLRAIIDRWEEFEVIGEAANGLEAISFCRKQQPDIILMDVEMPEMSGVDATITIHGEYPDIAIVMLTVSLDDRYLFSAMEGGARGYLLKDTPARKLRSSLYAIMKGDAILSGAVTTKLIDEFNKRHSDTTAYAIAMTDIDKLNEGEINILRCLAQGLTNEEIAAKLYLSEATVKKKLGVIMQKTNLENRVQVAVLAVRSGLID